MSRAPIESQERIDTWKKTAAWLQGEWFSTADVASAVKCDVGAAREALRRLERAGEVEAYQDHRSHWRYRKKSSTAPFLAMPWRKHTNAQLGIEES